MERFLKDKAPLLVEVAQLVHRTGAPMKTRVLLPFAGLTLLMILLVSGALCGSFSSNDDWTLSQASTAPAE
jgi:hypothetical protein